MSQYLLSCQCGESIAVRTQEAGESVRCPGCGQELIIPTLRNLLKLPIVAERIGPKQQTWTPTQGWLFALGTLTVLIAICVIVYCQIERGKLALERPSQAVLTQFHKDIAQLGLLEAWDIWTKVEKSTLGRRGPPLYLVHRQRDKNLRVIMMAAGGAGIAGLFCIVIALASGRGTPGR